MADESTAGGFDDDDGQAVVARRVEVGLVWRTSALAQALFICAGCGVGRGDVARTLATRGLRRPDPGVLSALGWQRLLRRWRSWPGPPSHAASKVNRSGSSSNWAPTRRGGRRPEAHGADRHADRGFRDGPPIRSTAVVSAPRWGRYPLQAHLAVVAPGGLLNAVAAAEVADVFVFPIAPAPPPRFPGPRCPSGWAPT